MLHILLLILKILLITVLVLLGFLIVILLIVLLVPVRYRVYVQKHESIFAKIKVSFMGFVLCFKAVYDDEGFKYKLKSFGGTLMTNQNRITDDEDGNNIQEEEPKGKKVGKRKKNKDVIDSEFEDNLSYDGLEQEDMEFLLEDTESAGKKQGIFKKIGTFFDKVVNGTKNKISAILEKLRGLKRKADEYKCFIRKRETKGAIHAVKKCLKKILKHLAPTRIKGELLYGAADPATTGQHLGYLSIALPLYYDKIDITPDFSQKILEGYLSVKGRIRLINLIIYGVQVLLNKNVMITIKRFKKLGGEKNG